MHSSAAHFSFVAHEIAAHFYMTWIIPSSSDAKRKNVCIFNQHSTGLLFRTSLTDKDDEFVDSFGRLKEREMCL